MKFVVIAILVTIFSKTLVGGPDYFEGLVYCLMAFIVFRLGMAYGKNQMRIKPMDNSGEPLAG